MNACSTVHDESQNPFSCFSPDNTYDIDAYDLVIDASTGTLPIEATSDNDGIRRTVLALAVDVT